MSKGMDSLDPKDRRRQRRVNHAYLDVRWSKKDNKKTKETYQPDPDD